MSRAVPFTRRTGATPPATDKVWSELADVDGGDDGPEERDGADGDDEDAPGGGVADASVNVAIETLVGQGDQRFYPTRVRCLGSPPEAWGRHAKAAEMLLMRRLERKVGRKWMVCEPGGAQDGHLGVIGEVK